MKGYVPTPDWIVDLMVAKLFADGGPAPEARILDPGSGRGAFIEGLIRWCTARGVAVPHVTGVESDPAHADYLRKRYGDAPSVVIREDDFLTGTQDPFDYVIGNPPYVALTGLDETERRLYRSTFRSASGRFDLYFLFFEQSLRLLAEGGKLVFITPEKFLYVQTAARLRALMSRAAISELHFLDERAFDDRVTYPVVTTLTKSESARPTRVVARSGATTHVRLTGGVDSWLPALNGRTAEQSPRTLADLCKRISCGVATGADPVFVVRKEGLPDALRRHAYPTVGGRDLTPGAPANAPNVMLIPYTRDGRLLPEDELGALGTYLAEPHRRAKLLARTCVRRKPWYAFHENPPMHDLLRPKLLCKDIGSTPHFVVDLAGDVVPRHSTYYLIPHDSSMLGPLADHLNSAGPAEWLQDNCQRAANGYIRLQSHVLRQLPIPDELAGAHGTASQTLIDWAA